MKSLKYLGAVALLSNLWASSAFALPIAWTDWQAGAATVATGQMTVGLDVIGVTATSTSNYNLVQTGTGTNYLTGDAYTKGEVDNSPTPSELIQLNAGGTVTLTFSQAIENIFIAVVSANGNTMDFGTAITIDSNGSGFWGAGTPIVNGTGTGFFGVGEVHGVIKAAGEFTSLSFTHTSENWHGFTLGVEGLAPSVPEPGSLLILLSGLLGFRLTRRRTV